MNFNYINNEDERVKRYKIGEIWARRVRSEIEGHGYTTNPYGQENTISSIIFREKIRRLYNSPTALFVRYQPDWVIVKNDSCYLVECKSELVENLKTPNYSFEKSAMDVGYDLHKIEVDIVVVFGEITQPVDEWRAEYLHKLITKEPRRQYNVHGSGTHFWLIQKNRVPLFNDFFNFLIHKK